MLLVHPLRRVALPVPLQLLIAVIAHAINARLARRVEYFLEENRVLREVFTETTGRKRIPLTDNHRRRLAVKGKALSPIVCKKPIGGKSVCIPEVVAE